MAVAARTSVSSRTAPFGLLADERLARLAAAGHERAFAVVYERHHQGLYRYCRSILHNDADAQDALQSTFTAAFAALRRGGPDAPIRPWLYRIAHNESVSTLRRRRPTVELSDATDYCMTSVDDQVEDRGRLALLLRDLHELHDRQRAALVMRELSGLSHEEIALALETSVGAAKQAIYEARRSLFEFAEGRAMPCDEIRRTISDADGRLLRSRRVRAHLRECPACAGFAAAISTRQGDLRALMPALPATAAAGLLVRAAGAGSAHGTGSGLAGVAAGGVGKTAGAALAANALAGAAVVATATVGVTLGVDRIAHGSSHPGAGRHGTPVTRSVVARHRAPALPGSPTAPRTVHRRAVFTRPGTKRSAPAHTAVHKAGRTPHPAAAGRGSTSTTAAPARTAVSTSPTSIDPGHSGAAPGHTPSTTRTGHSAAAPGHKATTSSRPGHSGAAPGHSGSVVSSQDHSSTAPGHLKTTSTSPGNSGSAPGHSASPSGGHTGNGLVAVPAAPALPLPVDQTVTHGASSATPPGHLK